MKLSRSSPEIVFAGVCALLGWALRILFVVRRPELSRSAFDTGLGLAAGMATDAAIALLVGAVLGLVHRLGARRTALALGMLWALVSTGLSFVETEYFAFSRNRFDPTFVAYLREWRTLSGSATGEMSIAFLLAHLVLVAGACGALVRLRPSEIGPTLAIGRRLLVSTLMVGWLLFRPDHAVTWFGDKVSKVPVVELVKAIGEARVDPPALSDDEVEAARRYSNALGVKAFVDEAAPLAHRFVKPSGAFGASKKPLNFVFLMLEGMEASLFRLSGGTLGLTPELDQLADQALYFLHFFANGAHTPRAMNASLCGLVPRLHGAPLSRAQPQMPVRCLPGVLRDEGYDTAFIHGGMEAFENRFEFLGHIGVQDTLFYEQFGRSLPRTNGGWGVTDAETYAEAERWLDRRSKDRLFFLTVLSISNHHPFHVPDPSLEREFDEALLPRNTARYTDREAAKFLEALRTRGLLENTVVFVFGDHGLTRSNLNADPGTDAAERMLERANVPLIVLGPEGIVPKGVVDHLASQNDLMPTVLELSGLQGTTPAFGHSLGFTLGETGRDLPVLVHDVYSQLVADVRPGAMEVVSLDAEAPGEAVGSWRWRRGEDGRLVAERSPADSERIALVSSVVRAVDELYRAERWWRPELIGDKAQAAHER